MGPIVLAADRTMRRDPAMVALPGTSKRARGAPAATKPHKPARKLAALFLAAVLGGCETASDLDVFGLFDEEPAVAETPAQAAVRERGDAETAAAGEQPTPALSSVPERPEAPTPAEVRARVVEGLAADRENARYSDETIRLQGSSRETTAATPAPAPPQPPSPPTSISPPPPPPPVASVQDRPAAPPPPPPVDTARATPPPPPPPAESARPTPPPPAAPSADVRTPSSSVIVDTTVLDSGGGFSAVASAAGIEEQVATIHFAHSSSRLDERDRQVLATVAAAQRQNNADVIVVGHASGRTQQLDKVDHDLANFRISLARANRVAEALVAMGVERGKINVEAAADEQPRYSEAMPTGEAGNRRAEIFFRQ